MIMAIPRIFRLNRHRQFNYTPMFYNAEREERERRNLLIAAELKQEQSEKYEFKSGIQRGSMRHYIKSNKRSTRNSSIRLVIIISILFFIAYILLYK